MRDQRLDFFRGLTMFIIFIAHTPGNSWNDWIPARFGFSSGTELFVFCSGCASAGAFGRGFGQVGWPLASAKILRRIWQIYWVQTALVLTSIAIAYLSLPLVGAAAFARFFPLVENGPRALVALVTLQWLPDFLDILPMYMVILALLPLFEFGALWRAWAPLALSALLWFYVQNVGLALPGNPFDGSAWFLNPFAWQFCFMLGYSCALSRLPCPPFRSPVWLIASLFILLAGFVFSFQPLVDHFAILKKVQSVILPETAKTDLAPVRMLHFLALAYVVLGIVEPLKNNLNQGLGALFVRIGRQSLAAFVASIVAAELAGIALLSLGSGSLVMLLINILGFGAILTTAIVVGWVKSEPWSLRGRKMSAAV